MQVGYIIQARMKSERLPGKILLPLPYNNGIPLLKCITDSLKQSKLTKKIIVATSLNVENDILEEFCINENVELFRGAEDDVLDRFISIAKKNQFDVIVRLTADNPFLDLALLENAIEQHYAKKKDYTKTEGLPLGMNFEIVRPEALLALETKQLSGEEKEHVTLFIRNHSKNQLLLNFGDKQSEKLRLTVDYPGDYAAASFLWTELEKNGLTVSFENIKKVAKHQPWIFEINQSNFQKKQYSSEQEEIEAAAVFLKMLDFSRAAKKLMEAK